MSFLWRGKFGSVDFEGTEFVGWLNLKSEFGLADLGLADLGLTNLGLAD